MVRVTGLIAVRFAKSWKDTAIRGVKSAVQNKHAFSPDMCKLKEFFRGIRLSGRFKEWCATSDRGE